PPTTYTLSLHDALPISITYNGTKGTRLDQTILPNSAPSGAKPLPFPSGYLYEMSNGDSIYHGASFQVQRRFRNGISANAVRWNRSEEHTSELQSRRDLV